LRWNCTRKVVHNSSKTLRFRFCLITYCLGTIHLLIMPPPSCPATYLLPENTSSDKTVQFCVHPKSFIICARKTELKVFSKLSERETERQRGVAEGAKIHQIRHISRQNLSIRLIYKWGYSQRFCFCGKFSPKCEK